MNLTVSGDEDHEVKCNHCDPGHSNNQNTRANPALAKDKEIRQKSDSLNTWPANLLLNPVSGNTFKCTRCHEIPVSVQTDDDGMLLCTECSRNLTHTIPNKAIQRMIDALATNCLSLRGDKDASDEGVSALDTQNEDFCGWVGTIKEWADHCSQCPFLTIVCKDCRQFECQRRRMRFHAQQCPKKSIACPLECGLMVLRTNVDHHLKNKCLEQLMECSNDDCKMQLKRRNFKQHVRKECQHRLVLCEFAKFGCSVKTAANNMRRHCDEYKFDHLSLKFDYISDISSQQQKTIDLLQNQVARQAVDMQKLQSRCLWKSVVFSKKRKTLEKSELWTCMVAMFLPQKKARFLCRYSFSCFATKGSNEAYRVYYSVQLNNKQLHPASGVHPTQICRSAQNEQVPISGSFVFELEGNETQNDRKIGLWHMGNKSCPFGISGCVLECYEMS